MKVFGATNDGSSMFIQANPLWLVPLLKWKDFNRFAGFLTGVGVPDVDI